MLTAMEVISGRFRDGTVFIPEVLLSARAMNLALTVLEPFLAKDKREASGKILIATVRGDLHDIGKNMVSTMLRGVGFEVVDLGINISVEDFVASVEKHRPDILGMSALLTTTMPERKKSSTGLRPAACGTRSRSWWAGRRSTRSSPATSAPTDTARMPVPASTWPEAC
jgi:methanogenic corrinoid protein MtbC1